jgi:hypothetical protein
VSTTLQGLTPTTSYYYRLVATNADGTVYGYTFSLVTAALPDNTASPSVSGTAQQGRVLTAEVGSWTPKPTRYSYQWQRDTGSGWSNISGATGQTYTPGVADLDATLQVIVSATDANGTAPATSSPTAAVLSGAPVNATAPTITGSSLKQGVALSVAVGTWNPAAKTYSYQWLRNTDAGWVAITGATAASYTPGTADLGAQLEVQLTAHNPYGAVTVTASASGTVSSGAPVNTTRPRSVARPPAPTCRASRGARGRPPERPATSGSGARARAAPRSAERPPRPTPRWWVMRAAHWNWWSP